MLLHYLHTQNPVRYPARNPLTDSPIDYAESDFHSCELPGEGRSTKFHIWSVSGQQRYFDKATTHYSKSADVCLLCFQITDNEAFDGEGVFTYFEKIINAVRDSGNEKVKFVLVATKLDLKVERVISEVDANNFAKTNNMPYFETSAVPGAAENKQISAIFDWCIKQNSQPIPQTDLFKSKGGSPAEDSLAKAQQLLAKTRKDLTDDSSCSLM